MIPLLPYTLAYFIRAYQRAFWTQMLTCQTPWGIVKVRSTMGLN